MKGKLKMEIPAEVLQWEQVSGATQVGGGTKTKQVSGTAKMSRVATQKVAIGI